MKTFFDEFRAFASKRGLSHNTFIVGGAVRDALRGSVARDMDLAFRGDAVSLAKEFADAAGASFVLLDEDFGSARAVRDSMTLDVSRMRDGDLTKDLGCRDLTINAMALPLMYKSARRELMDPLGGLKDLRSKTVRMVSEENLVADPLRVLRVYRFAVEPGYTIDRATLAASRRNAHLLAGVAAERVMEELRHILGATSSSQVLKAMLRDGVLSSVVAIGLGQKTSTVKLDVPACKRLEDILLRAGPLGREIPKGKLNNIAGMKMALVLGGLGPARADRALKGLRASNRERDFVTGMLEGVRRFSAAVRKPPGDIVLIRLFREYEEDIHPLIALCLALWGTRFRPVAGRMLDYYSQVAPRMSTEPLVTGDDLIGEFGLRPSPFFRKVLTRVDDLHLQGRISSREEALAAVADIIRVSRA